MPEKTIISFLFAFHFLLFIVKIWAVSFLVSLFVFTQSQSHRLMIVFRYSTALLLIFSLLVTGLEAWYLYSFFVPEDLYFYEYVAILDQVIFTYIAISYLIKEGKQ